MEWVFDESESIHGRSRGGGHFVFVASGVTADDYPGPDGRPLADDGHFVEVTATVASVAPVPEPSTALLFGLGLCGLSADRARKR